MEEYLQTAISAAIVAGREIMEVYADPASDWEIEYKADHSPLTVADRRAHRVIAERLEQTPFPVLSEEGAYADYAQRREWSSLWVVDPLDGTKEFVRRNGEFTVNIALVEAGRPVLGVVYAPAVGVIYYGSEGGGAFKAQVDLATGRMSGACSLPQPAEAGAPYTVVASRSHLSPETEAYIERLRREKGEVKLVQGGSSLKICLVAEGVAHQYPRLGPTMEWDTAAGHAVVRAAGGEMYDAATDRPVVYNKEDLHSPWFIVKGAGA